MNQTDDRKTCSLCNRKFNSDRLEKHIEICKKQKEKKRIVFDSSKQRQIVDASDESSESVSKQVTTGKAKIVKPVKKPATKLDNKKLTKNRATMTNGKNSEDKSSNDRVTMNGKLNSMKEDKTKQVNGTVNQTNETGHSNGIVNEKSKWREKHEEFVKSIQTIKKVNGTESGDNQTQNKHESIDKESTITTNSDSTNSATNTTTSTATSTITLNTTTNERGDDSNGESNKSKITQSKIQPPQATRLKKLAKSNQTNGQHSNNKLVNGQALTNGNLNSLNATSHNGNGDHHTTTGNKKSMNACIECAICGRTFNRAAGERHIPFCAAKERQRKSSSNVSNEEALARFRLRNAYRSNKTIKKRDKSVPNEKEKKDDKYVRQTSLRRALSTIDGLDQVFTKGLTGTAKLNHSTTNLPAKRSTSQGNLNRSMMRHTSRDAPAKRLQIVSHSKSSSASSKGSVHNHSSVGYREQAQSRVKARLNQQQKIQKQRMNSNYPKTPVMKFKEKFPNHNNKLIEFADSQQFSQMFKKHLNNSSFESNNMPKTVPGVRTGGLSPTKEIHNKNGHNMGDMNDDLEHLRARIKEMYLGTNGSHSQNDFINLDYHLSNNEFGNENSFTRENSSSKLKSKSVNDFLTINDGLDDALNDIELPKSCHTCSTDYITMSARYCFNCGSRRLGTVNSYLV